MRWQKALRLQTCYHCMLNNKTSINFSLKKLLINCTSSLVTNCSRQQQMVSRPGKTPQQSAPRKHCLWPADGNWNTHFVRHLWLPISSNNSQSFVSLPLRERAKLDKVCLWIQCRSQAGNTEYPLSRTLPLPPPSFPPELN